MNQAVWTDWFRVRTQMLRVLTGFYLKGIENVL